MAYDTATYIKNGERKTGKVSQNSNDYWQGVANRLEQQLAEQKQANADQLALSQEANVQQLEYATGVQNENTQRLNTQLYLDRMKQERTLPQELAALGITGGAAETSLVGIGNRYAQNLAENERARLTAIGALNQDVIQTNYQARAQQIAADAQAMQAYYNARNAMEQAQYEQKLEIAQALAEAGDFSMAVQMGLYTRAQAQRLYEIWAYENQDFLNGGEEEKQTYTPGTPIPTPTPTPGTMTASEFARQALQVKAVAGKNEAEKYINENVNDVSSTALQAAKQAVKYIKTDNSGMS